jgi:ABC-type transporter Mla subunit MlaD
MTGVEVALLIILTISMIALISTLVVTLRRMDALSRETTELLQVTRVELASTLQEIRGATSNLSELVSEVTSTVNRVDRALEALERFEPANMVVSVAGKVARGAGISLSSLAAGVKEAVKTYRHPDHPTPPKP